MAHIIWIILLKGNARSVEMTLTKVLNKRDIDRIPSDILKKLKKHYINNEQFIELKELYNTTKSNMGKYYSLFN